MITAICRFETRDSAALPETDIFETYGLRAKHYDALVTKSRQEDLNPDEQAFVEAFGVLLTADDEDRDEAEADMLATHRAWMDADNG